MPIAKLFIEGNLESEVLNPILEGTPVLQQGGSKDSLKPRARADRSENGVMAGYLRDRDFDFDPPADISRPTVDSEEGGMPVGWRWVRHEIENYLIEPVLVNEAMTWPIPEVEEALRQSAREIRHYEAARWSIGVVRRDLPPHYELKTRPDGLNDIDLPVALDSVAVNAWASESIAAHRGRINASTDPLRVQESIEELSERFDDAFILEVANVLVWFSGKDLLAGMNAWLATKGVPNPGAFRALMRDWIIANPLRTIELLPEWNALIEVVRA